MRRLLVVLSLLLLGGCETLADFRITTNKPIAVPDIQPGPMQLKPVSWKVYTVDELKALVASMEAAGQTTTVFYVLDKENFDSLAFNLVEMKRYIEDQRATNQFLIEAIAINNGEDRPPRATLEPRR